MSIKFFFFLISAFYSGCFCFNVVYKQNDIIPQNQITVKYDSTYQTKQFMLKDTSGLYSFEVYLSDINKGIIRYRYVGNNPLKVQTISMALLLKHIFSDTSLKNEFTTLQWGRLNNSTNLDFTLSKRLIIAASLADGWNKKSGKPFKGHENSFVKDLANETQIYPELVRLFTRFGYTITISGVEKVLVQKAGKLSFWTSISEKVNGDEKLPYDCQTWFQIEKK